MKTLLTLLIFSCCSVAATHAQNLRYFQGLPYTTLSAYSIKQNDAFSFTGNQAALAQTKVGGLGIAGERRFMLDENSLYAVALALPTKDMGNFGISAQYSGFSDFNENKIGLAYGRKLGDKLDIGAQFNYYGYKIPAYTNANSINFEAGIIMHVLPKLNVGVHTYNPVGGELRKIDGEKLAYVHKAGVGFDATDNFYVSAEVIKEEDRPISVTGGMQYQFKKQFFARAGFISETGSAYAGAGIAWKTFRLDVASGYHPQLGLSPALMLIYNFKELPK